MVYLDQQLMYFYILYYPQMDNIIYYLNLIISFNNRLVIHKLYIILLIVNHIEDDIILQYFDY